jgi:hypothetical protein
MKFVVYLIPDQKSKKFRMLSSLVIGGFRKITNKEKFLLKKYGVLVASNHTDVAEYIDKDTAYMINCEVLPDGCIDSVFYKRKMSEDKLFWDKVIACKDGEYFKVAS